MQFNNAPAPVTLRANRLRTDAGHAANRARRPRAARVSRALCSRRPACWTSAAPRGALAGRVPGAGRGLAARDPARRTGPWPAAARHLRVARRQDGGVCRSAGQWRSHRRLRCPRAPDAPAPADGRVGGRDQRAPGAGRRAASPCRSGARSTRWSSTPPVRASARSGAIPTSAGGGRRPTSSRWPPRMLTMLGHAAVLVRPGGRLIYATCSSEPEENEHVASRFLERAAEFAPLDARLAHPALPPEVVDPRGHLRTTPAPLGLEGFFGAVFERRRVA